MNVVVRLSSQQRELVDRLAREGCLGAESAPDLIARAVREYFKLHPEPIEDGGGDD